ncbi:phage head closure protein [Fangia hongkongensis]|uniref:phage head closure protein n=1 Tax=Fangia hongkongensis TaxID=270495 RepID=UPI0003769C8E|nr:phage head closure protein [Fangia hongkongensis]MBK2125727.1 phage head closure protein [Fangia hongkongensis]
MSSCKKIIIQKRKVCIGDLNKYIGLYTRSLTSPLNPSYSSVDYDLNFTLIRNVWAAIENVKGIMSLDGVTDEEIPTHNIYIRYRNDITSENWIIFNNKNYKIIRVENLEENNIFLCLVCIETGSTSKGASKS